MLRRRVFFVHTLGRHRTDAGNCAASSPKRLHLGEIRIGFRSDGHRSLDPCVLKSGQKASGERPVRVRTLMGNTYCRDSFFVHSDVVKVAEPILQASEGVKELLAPLQRPFPREQAGKELHRVAQFLGLDAELVATALIELGERFTFLANLPPRARQLFDRKNRNGKIAPVAYEIVPWVRP